MEVNKLINKLNNIAKEFKNKKYSFEEILNCVELNTEWITNTKKDFYTSDTYKNSDQIIFYLLHNFFEEYVEKLDIVCGWNSKEFKNITDKNLQYFGSSYAHLHGIKLDTSGLSEWNYSNNIPNVGDKKIKKNLKINLK